MLTPAQKPRGLARMIFIASEAPLLAEFKKLMVGAGVFLGKTSTSFRAGEQTGHADRESEQGPSRGVAP